jgi:DNA-binding transcriptional regulator YhcF (GntR family)
MIDPDLPVSLWEQLAGMLRAKVASGELAGRVPSLRSLSQEYGVSTRTTERALTTLRDALTAACPGLLARLPCVMLCDGSGRRAGG